MNVSLKRLLALLLVAVMALSAVACAAGPETSETQPSGDTGAGTEDETSYKPNIPEANYNTEFNFMNYSSILDHELFLVDESQRGDPMSDAVYERALVIKDQLGVTMVRLEAGDWKSYAAAVLRTVQSGDDAYQLVMTHGTTGAGTLVTANALYNYSDFEDVNLEAPYWNQSIMSQAMIGDRYLLGYGDFSLSHVHCLIFNKDMMDEYGITASYDLVDNQQWTLDRFIAMAATVSKDNGDGKWDDQDTYGLTGWCGTYMTSFLVAGGLNVIEKDESDDSYYLAYSKNIEKLSDMTDKLIALGNSNYAYLEGIGVNEKVDFSNGTSLFQFYDAADLAILRDSSVRFGVLPFPKWNDAQDDYRCLSMNGMMCIPSSIKDPTMVGRVMELLNYHTAKVKVAFYEDLLGSKLAEAPDDARMLDVIWDHQVFEPALIAYDAGTTISDAFYFMSNQVKANKNTVSSSVSRMARGINKILEKFFNADPA